MLPASAPAPKGGEEEADDRRVGVEAAHDEDGQHCDQTLRSEIDERNRGHHRAKQLVVEDVAEAGEETTRRLVGRRALARAHEHEDDEERKDVRRCVDQEHLRRADPRNQ